MDRLFTEKRACECCGNEATPRKRVPGEANVLAISFTIYRRGSGKRSLKAARRVRICEECFVRALAAPTMFGNSTARRFLAAIRESLSARYSAMLEDDRKDRAA